MWGKKLKMRSGWLVQTDEDPQHTTESSMDHLKRCKFSTAVCSHNFSNCIKCKIRPTFKNTTAVIMKQKSDPAKEKSGKKKLGLS